jgi:hypothetical protein
MAKRKKSKRQELIDEWRARQPERDRITRQLEERIAYHKRKLAEERAARESA